MRTTLQERLDLVQATLQEEGSLVLRSLRAVLNAIEQGDTELADEVIAFDDEVDERYSRVEQLIEELLALQAPTASDLRLVLAMSKVNLHLERMADYCVTIAKMTKLSSGLPGDLRMVEWLEDMGTRAEEMIRVALDAFATRDVTAAESLMALDEMIDRANRRAVDEVCRIAADESSREWGVRMLLVSRCLERIGDHAVDIGEQVAYLVTGDFRELTDASHRT